MHLAVNQASSGLRGFESLPTHNVMIKKEKLEKLYKKGLSMQEITERTGWSYHQVTYWMDKFNIPRRSRSKANYIKYNPKGDPFNIKKQLTKKERELKGLGIGLYWGEGNRKSKSSVRLANTDAQLIKRFREFLTNICGVKKDKIKYSLQVFNDADSRLALSFWAEELKIPQVKLGKVSALSSRGRGTYKNKNQYGVLSIYVHNTKFKKQVDKLIEKI